jgi:hypothetical protein
MAQVLSRQPVILQFWVRSQVSLFEICRGQSGIGTGFVLSLAFHQCAVLAHSSVIDTASYPDSVVSRR